MPYRNVEKDFRELTYYHVYNRGINKQETFHDSQDYFTYRYILRKELQKFGTIKIDYFCLMPNHFHFLLYQHEINAMTKFMTRTTCQYVIYHNKKYDRIGPIFMPKYRARLIPTVRDYSATLDYIRDNPEKAEKLYWKHFGSEL